METTESTLERHTTGSLAALRSETAKLLSLAFPRRLGLLAVLASPICAVLFLTTTGVTQSESLEELSPADITGTALLGIDAASLVMIVLGAWSVGGEYASGMIHTSLVVTPRRSTHFLAKILCIAVAAALAGTAAAVTAFVAAQLELLGHGSMVCCHSCRALPCTASPGPQGQRTRNTSFRHWLQSLSSAGQRSSSVGRSWSSRGATREGVH